jgi:hypothetical protein
MMLRPIGASILSAKAMTSSDAFEMTTPPPQ